MRAALQTLVLAVLFLAPLAACGDPIDRASQVSSLRVLAVRADTPFAKPGAEAHLKMLLFDGSPAARRADGTSRPVHILWLGSCVNPAGDIYYQCYPTLHQTMASFSDSALAQEQVPAGVPAGFGQEYTIAIPSDTISSRPQREQVIHPYGQVFVFYAACAGDLRKPVGADPVQDLPVLCVDPNTGQTLGQADFEFGYYPLYVYEDLENRNPGLQEATVQGKPTGEACQDSSECSTGQTCGSQKVCIPILARCGEEDSDNCPAYAFVPVVARSTVDKAVTAQLSEETAPAETFWVAYFGTAGVFDKDLRMVHEPSAGWLGDYVGEWRAQVAAGTEVRLWAVLRDNRNGVSWASQDVFVQ